ncbi:MAG: hypothetical protein HY769_03050 [Candidatus Stahlbacteria bacterium]|nr:hypothetical protein [Candidatus Stahlbacteria bacterium]
MVKWLKRWDVVKVLAVYIRCVPDVFPMCTCLEIVVSLSSRCRKSGQKRQGMREKTEMVEARAFPPQPPLERDKRDPEESATTPIPLSKLQVRNS